MLLHFSSSLLLLQRREPRTRAPQPPLRLRPCKPQRTMYGGFGAAGGWDWTESGHYLLSRRTLLENGTVGVVKGWRVPLTGAQTLQFLIVVDQPQQQYVVLDEEAIKRGLLQEPSPLVPASGEKAGSCTPGGSSTFHSTGGSSLAAFGSAAAATGAETRHEKPTVGLSSPKGNGNGSRSTAATPEQGSKGKLKLAKRPRPEPGPAVTKDLMDKLRVLLRRLVAPPVARSFCKPVAELFPQMAERYSSVIERPMDLSTVYVKLAQGLYPTLDRFERDVNRTFLNCERFNAAGQQANLQLAAQAKHLREFFKGLLSEMVEGQVEDKRKRREDRLRDWKDVEMTEAELQLMREELGSMEPPVDASSVLGRAGSSVWSLYQAIVAVEDWGLRAALEEVFHLATVFVQERASRGAVFSSIWAKPVGLAWASQKKPPFWPCMVIMEGSTPEPITRVNRQRMPPDFLKGLLKRTSRPASAVVVETFGVHDFMWAAPDVVRPYTGPASDPNEKQVKNPQFQEGLREIEAAYQAQQGRQAAVEGGEEEEGEGNGAMPAAAEEEEGDDPLRVEGGDLSRLQEEVEANREAIVAADDEDDDDDEELLQQALAHRGEEERKTTSSGRPRVPKKPKGADMSPEATPTNKAASAAKRKRSNGVKVKKQRALDKIREFIATHLLTEKVMRELDVEHRPKVKRRLITTPQPFTLGVGPRDVLDAPMLFGGRPPPSYDPYETESDLDELGEEDVNTDWSVVSQRKNLLRRREQGLQREILALQEMRRRQRVFAERALGHAFVEANLAPLPPSSSSSAADHQDLGLAGGSVAAATTHQPPRKQGGGAPRRPRTQPVDGPDGHKGEAAPSSTYERSMYTGVCRSGNRWVARITYGGKKHNLGSYENEKEAALAYDNAARQQFGLKAKLNEDDNSDSDIAWDRWQFDSNGVFTGHKQSRRPAAPRGQAAGAPEAVTADQQPVGYAPRPAYQSDDTEDEEEEDAYRPSLMVPREAMSETESDEEEDDEDEEEEGGPYARASYLLPTGRYAYG